jgi:orotate phosphoribosyltransferase-like protein
MTGCSRATIANIIKRAMELQAAGKSSAAIGNELGITREAALRAFIAERVD